MAPKSACSVKTEMLILSNVFVITVGMNFQDLNNSRDGVSGSSDESATDDELPVPRHMHLPRSCCKPPKKQIQLDSSDDEDQSGLGVQGGQAGQRQASRGRGGTSHGRGGRSQGGHGVTSCGS